VDNLIVFHGNNNPKQHDHYVALLLRLY